jgi:quinol monooxygenase YgiN
MADTAGMIVISGTARIRPDVKAAAKAAALDMAAQSAAEPGCVVYEISELLDDPFTFRLFEQWESAEALAAHFATPHFVAFSRALPGFLAAPPRFTRYEVARAGLL